MIGEDPRRAPRWPRINGKRRRTTIGAARALRLDGKVGTIAPGRRADLAVINGDPLADIRAIGFVVGTMRAGVVSPSAPLYEAIGVRPPAAM